MAQLKQKTCQASNTISFTKGRKQDRIKKISFEAYSSGYGAYFDEVFPENVENVENDE